MVPVSLIAFAGLHGCVFPNLAPLRGTKQVSRITIGETSRDEVVELLGPPNVAAGEGFLVYNWEKSRAFWVLAGGYTAAAGPMGHRGFRAIVEFDENALVTGLFTASAESQPKPIPEKLSRLLGCGIKGSLPNAVAISPDGEQAAELVRGELCIVGTGNPEFPRRIDLGKSRNSTAYGAFLSFSPDGRRLAVAPAGQRPAIWDIETGLKIEEFGCTDASVNMKYLPPRPVAFSPDGRHFTTPDCGGGVVTWEIERGVELNRHMASSGVTSIAFSNDGGLIALGLWGGGLEILDGDTGTSLMLRAAVPDSSATTVAAFSPDGQWLAVGTTVHVELWKIANLRETEGVAGRKGSLLLPFHRASPGHNNTYQPMIGFSEDSGTLAVFKDRTFCLIDVQSLAMRDLYRFKYPAVSADLDKAWRKLVVISTFDGLRMWEVPEQARHPAADIVH